MARLAAGPTTPLMMVFELGLSLMALKSIQPSLDTVSPRDRTHKSQPSHPELSGQVLEHALFLEMPAHTPDIDPTASTVPSPEIRLYKPLKSWETRLIKLLPGTVGEPLQCELHHAALTIASGLGVAEERDPVQYTALSYSWGHPERSAPIVCNGLRLGVPPSLAEALRQIRHHCEKQWLWCDAISIDQRDLDEKAVQVKQMLLIFEKAERVVAWLGESGPGMEKLARMISGTGTGAQKKARRKGRSKSAAILSKSTKAATRALLRRPWFHRTWVRQEVFAAQILRLRVGRFEMLLEDLDRLATFARIQTPQLRSLVASHYEAQKDNAITSSTPLSDITSKAYRVLIDNQYFQATDDHDRIFALMGMMDTLSDQDSDAASRKRHELLQAFPIDYRQSVETLYTEFARLLIVGTGSIRSLEVLGYRQAPLSNMRSWSTDWRTARTPGAYYCTRDAYQIPRFFLDQSPLRNQYFFDPWPEYTDLTSAEPLPKQPIEPTNKLHLFGYRLGIIPSSPRVCKPHALAWRFLDESYLKLSRLMAVPSRRREYRRTLDRLIQEDRLCAIIMETTEDSDGQGCSETATEQNFMCGVLVDAAVREGDLVVQLIGSRMIHVLRPSLATVGQEKSQFSLICAGWVWHQDDRLPSKDSISSLYPFPQMFLCEHIHKFAEATNCVSPESWV